MGFREKPAMTAAEWESSADPAAMLADIQSTASERKLRLFAAACHANDDYGGLASWSEWAEFTENKSGFITATDGARMSVGHKVGQAHVEKLNTAEKAKRADLLRCVFGNPFRPEMTFLKRGDTVSGKPGSPLFCGSGRYDFAIVVSVNPFVLVSPHGDMVWSVTKKPSDVCKSASEQWNALEAFNRWERDRVNFKTSAGTKTAPLDRYWLSWNSGTVPAIAACIYEERRWQDMPVLADALEEAGCDNEAIIAHCREVCRYCKDENHPPYYAIKTPKGPWVKAECASCNGTRLPPRCRGDWVIDLTLGKE